MERESLSFDIKKSLTANYFMQITMSCSSSLSSSSSPAADVLFEFEKKKKKEYFVDGYMRDMLCSLIRQRQLLEISEKSASKIKSDGES